MAEPLDFSAYAERPLDFSQFAEGDGRKPPARGGGSQERVPMFWVTERGSVNRVGENLYEGEDGNGGYFTARREDFKQFRPVYRDPNYRYVHPEGAPEVRPRKRTAGERFSENVEDAIQRGPVMAGARAILPKGQYRIPGSDVMQDSIGQQMVDAERARREEFQIRSGADPFYKAEGGVLGKTAAGASTLGGQFLGTLSDPVNAGTSTITGGGSLARQMVVQGGVNAGVDVATQGLDLSSGTQDEYSPLQTVGAGALGAAFPAGGALVQQGYRGVRRAAAGLDPKIPDVNLNGLDFSARAIDPAVPPKAAGGRTRTPRAADNTDGPGGAEPFTETMARAAIKDMFPDAVITSGRRSEEDNARVGGAPNSWHKRGGAVDLVPPKGVTLEQFRARLRARGLPVTELIDEGDHFHWAFGGGQRTGGAAPADMGGGGVDPIAPRPAPETRIFTQDDEPPFGATPVPREAAPPPVKPEDLKAPDLTDIALDTIRRGKEVDLDQGPSLIEFVAKSGGIADPGGELRSADLDVWHRQRPFQPRAVKDDGLPIEEMAQRAWEAGYFRDIAPPRMDAADNMQAVDSSALIAALRDELAGKPRFARDPSPDKADLRARTEEMQEILDHLGIDARHHDNTSIKRAIGEFFAGGREPIKPPKFDPVTGNPYDEAADIFQPGFAKAAKLSMKAGGEGKVERVKLGDGEADQRLIPGVEPINTTQQSIAAELRRRQAKRGAAAPEEGSLFGAPKPEQTDLFSGPAFDAKSDELRARLGPRWGAINDQADLFAGASRSAAGQAPDGGRPQAPGRGLGGGEDRAAQAQRPNQALDLPDRNHRELYAAGVRAARGEDVPLAEWEGLAARFGRYMDWTDAPEAAGAAFKGDLPPPEVMRATAIRYASDVAADPVNMADLRLYDPDRMDEVLTSAKGDPGRLAMQTPPAAPRPPRKPVQGRAGPERRTVADPYQAPDEALEPPAGPDFAARGKKVSGQDFSAQAEEPILGKSPDSAPAGTLAAGVAPGSLKGAPRRGAVPAGPERADLAGKTVSQLAARLRRAIGAPTRQGRLSSKRQLGVYNTESGVARVKPVHELDVLSHELTHALEYQDRPNVLAALKKHAKHLKTLAYAGADPKALRQEGFAEFGRWYVTNPDHARKMAPKFYDDFEAALAKDAPEMLADLRGIQQAYQDYLKAGSLDVAAASIVYAGKKGPVSELIKSFQENGIGGTMQKMADAAYTAVFDDLHPLAMAVRRLQEIYATNKGQGLDLKVAKNPYALARLSRDAYGAGHNDLMHGVTPYKGVDPEGPSLSAAMEKALGDKVLGKFPEDMVRLFDGYLASRRFVHEWKRYHDGELDTPPDGNTLAHHQQVIADADKAHPTWAEAASMIYEWNTNLWKKERAAGLITFEAYAAGLEKQDYVPLMRDVSDKATGNSRPKGAMRYAGGVKRFKGSTRDVISPTASMMRRAYELNAIIKRNDIIKALDDLAKAAGRGGGEIVERLPKTEVEAFTTNAADALETAAKAAGLDPRDISTMMQAAELDLEAQATFFKRKEMDPRKGESIVWVWRNGEKQPLLLGDGQFGQDMFTALAGLTQMQRNGVVDAMAAGTQTLRYGVTLSPEFMARNYIRDQLATWINTDVGFKPVITSARGALSELTQDKLAIRYTSAGGMKGGANVAATQNRYPATDAEAFAKIRQLKQKGYKIKRYANWRGLAEMTDLSETSTRLGVAKLAFQQAKKRGLNDYEAMLDAAFVSRDYLDFGRRGSRMMSAIRVVTFLNAALQGLDKTTRVLTAGGNLHKVLAPLGKNAPRTPAEKRALVHAYKAWAKVSVLGMIGLGLRMLYADDPEYEEIGDRLRATHWIAKVGGKWVFVPKPFELATLSNIFERAYEAGALKDPKALERLLSDFKYTVVPPHEIPALAVPFNIARNRDAFGKPIVPDHLRGRVDPELQYSGYTSEFGKMIGRAFGVSPAVVDYSITGFGGSLGKYALQGSDLGVEALTDKPRTAVGPQDAFLARAFLRDVTRGSASQKQFWDLMSRDGGKFTTAEGTFRSLMGDGKDDEAVAYLAKQTPETRAFIQAKVFTKGGSSKFHPMVRSQEALSVISEVRRETRDGSLTNARGLLIPLTPSSRKEVDDALAYLSMSEMRNSMIAAGVPGWAQREPIPTSEAWDRLEAASPEAAASLRARLRTERVPDEAVAGRAWERLRPRYEAEPDRGELGRLMSGKRLKSPDKMDRIREAARLGTLP